MCRNNNSVNNLLYFEDIITLLGLILPRTEKQHTYLEKNMYTKKIVIFYFLTEGRGVSSY